MVSQKIICQKILILYSRSHFKTCRLEYHNAVNCQAKIGGKTWRGEDSQKRNGQRFGSIYPSRQRPRGGDAHASRLGAALRGSSGFSGPAPHGVSCRGSIAAPAPAGGGSRTGKR